MTIAAVQGAAEQWSSEFAAQNGENDWANQFAEQFADGADPNQWMEEFAQDMDARQAAAEAGMLQQIAELSFCEPVQSMLYAAQPM